MPTEWAVTTAVQRFALGPDGRGETTFTVTNPGTVTDFAFLDVVPGDGADRSWFTVPEPQRPLPAGASAAFKVIVAAPPGTPAGAFSLQARVSSAGQAPEETSRLSSRVAFDIPPTPKPAGRAWWPYAVAAALVLIVLLAAGWLVFGRGGTKSGAAQGGASPSPSGVVSSGKGNVKSLCGVACSERLRMLPALTGAAEAPYLTPSDCVQYSPAALAVNPAGTDFQLGDGSKILAVLSTKANADDALAVAKQYSEVCFIGRVPLPETNLVYYWHKPTGTVNTIANGFCVSYDNTSLTVEAVTGGWRVHSADGTDFGPFKVQANAQSVKQVAAAFKSMCLIWNASRPDAYLNYWQK